jgi:hypothetical protein
MMRPSYLVTTLAANTQASMAATSAPSTPRRSVEIEEVEEEGRHSGNVSPSNASRTVESTDRSDDEEGRKAARAIDIDNDSSDEEPVAKETDEAERGMILSRESIRLGNMLILIQTALQKNGTHQSMHSSTLSHLLTMLETQPDVFMSSSATRRHVRAKA